MIIITIIIIVMIMVTLIPMPTPKTVCIIIVVLCVSSLRMGHANLLCIVPILTDDPHREYKFV